MNNEQSASQVFFNKKFVNAVFLVVIILAGYLFVQMVSAIKEYNYIGGGVPATNTITVSGEGTAFAVPDIAEFTFSVSVEEDTVAAAQAEVEERIDAALAVLEEADVEDRDIRTVGYNIYPRYDYIQEVCNQFRCPPGRQELRGYEVMQSIAVKVRETEDAGSILTQIGNAGVTNVSGLTFTVDDEDEPIREARQEAINEAKDKARQLANDLGVDLVRVVNFNENRGGYYPMYNRAMMDAAPAGLGGGVEESASLPVGENEITSNVSITYEIR